MAAHVPALTWTSVTHVLQAEGENQCRCIASDQIGHPLDDGFVQTGTAADGTYLDYARFLGGETWLAVREYTDFYYALIARRSAAPTTILVEQESEPAQSRSFFEWLGSLFTESPGTAVALGAVAGAVGGALLGGAKGAAVGAGIGGGVSLAGVAVSNAERSPATAQVAQNMFEVLASAGLGGPARRSVAKKLPPALAPAPTSARRKTQSRIERFDRADFEVRYRKRADNE